MKIILKIDDKNLRRGFVDFKRANVIATKNTLDIAASLSRRNAVSQIKTDFILRNTWTVRNIQFEKVRTNKIRKMKSRIGATVGAPYMKIQELGGQRKRSVTGKTAIGQKKARLNFSGARPVKKSLYISRIAKKIVRGKTTKNFRSHRARAVAAMAMAYKKKLYIKRSENIYEVTSFSGEGIIRAQLEHIYNIVSKPIYIKKEAWLMPAIKKPAHDLFNIYKSQLKKLWKYERVI